LLVRLLQHGHNGTDRGLELVHGSWMKSFHRNRQRNV
jgi:hypothetical protein